MHKAHTSSLPDHKNLEQMNRRDVEERVTDRAALLRQKCAGFHPLGSPLLLLLLGMSRVGAWLFPASSLAAPRHDHHVHLLSRQLVAD
jgi:hypothetical protein